MKCTMRKYRTRRVAGKLPTLALGFAVSLAPVPAQAVAQDDPFPACMTETGGDGKTCLARQGGWYDWAPSAAACRFVGEKVDAIIAAGGDAKWADLFRNERCARLGLPHGPVAAAAGASFLPDHPHTRCRLRTGLNFLCDEPFGRHGFAPVSEVSCSVQYFIAKRYRAGELPYSPDDAFQNERCWRLGLPHFEPE